MDENTASNVNSIVEGQDNNEVDDNKLINYRFLLNAFTQFASSLTGQFTKITAKIGSEKEKDTILYNIATNADNIATNTANIATNANNIAANTKKIGSTEEKDTILYDIYQHNSKINVHNVDIATNKTNIATNTANIATNTAKIGSKEEKDTILYNIDTILNDISADRRQTITGKIPSEGKSWNGPLADSENLYSVDFTHDNLSVEKDYILDLHFDEDTSIDDIKAIEDEWFDKIVKYKLSNGKITFYANAIPSKTFPIKIKELF